MNSIFVLTDDYSVYEIPDVTKDKVLDERVRTPLTEPPVCMCAGGSSSRGENSVDLYLADSTGQLYQVGKEDCAPLVCYCSLLVIIFISLFVSLEGCIKGNPLFDVHLPRWN